jgi:hypothetical protein
MRFLKDATIFEFLNLESAYSFASRCSAPMQILLGDSPHYWVVNVNEAERLAALGYEFATSERIEPLKLGIDAGKL